MAKLCVNVDHVATVRQARRITEPDPVAAAVLAELGGAAGITCHLREDRRHMQDDDIRRLRETVKTTLNLEIAPTAEMLDFARTVRPDMVMFVPEKREEITTEGGLDVAANLDRVCEATRLMLDEGLRVSHFIDPEERQIQAACECGAEVVELHTGFYANATTLAERQDQLQELLAAARSAAAAGRQVNAGHGLNLRNILPIAAIPGLCELHIGHSIVAHSVLVGFERATREMVDAIAHAGELAWHHDPMTILRLVSP